MLQDIGSQNLIEKHIYTKVYIYIFIFFKQFGKNGAHRKHPLQPLNKRKIDSKEADVCTLNSTHLWKVVTHIDLIKQNIGIKMGWESRLEY